MDSAEQPVKGGESVMQCGLCEVEDVAEDFSEILDQSSHFSHKTSAFELESFPLLWSLEG